LDLSTANWRKSSSSSGGGQGCVEVAVIAGSVAIRDSKNPDGPVHLVSPDSFRDLIFSIKRGDLNI
jgi:hypothetical protein